jgi:hypothetical protein
MTENVHSFVAGKSCEDPRAFPPIISLRLFQGWYFMFQFLNWKLKNNVKLKVENGEGEIRKT